MARPARIENILSLTADVAEAAQSDSSAALALLLLDNTKPRSVCGEWCGRISSADQRTLFGQYVGKGRFYIDGATETVEMTINVCPTGIRETKHRFRWSELPLREKAHDVRVVREAA